MILGHITATYALREPFKKKIPALASPWPVLAGALLPDLVDKPLAMVTGMPGRALGHSLVVEALLFAVLYALLPGRRTLLEGVALGVLLHVLEDVALAAVMFWPLAGPWPYVESMPLGDKLYSYYFQLRAPAQGVLEYISYPFFIWFLVRRSIFKKPAKPVYEGTGG